MLGYKALEWPELNVIFMKRSETESKSLETNKNGADGNRRICSNGIVGVGTLFYEFCSLVLRIKIWALTKSIGINVGKPVASSISMEEYSYQFVRQASCVNCNVWKELRLPLLLPLLLALLLLLLVMAFLSRKEAKGTNHSLHHVKQKKTEFMVQSLLAHTNIRETKILFECIQPNMGNNKIETGEWKRRQSRLTLRLSRCVCVCVRVSSLFQKQ